ARGQLLLAIPRLEDLLGDGHAGLALGAEVEVEDQVFHVPLERDPDRLLRCRGAQQIGGRPALQDPGAPLRDRVGRVIGHEDPEAVLMSPVALGHPASPPLTGTPSTARRRPPGPPTPISRRRWCLPLPSVRTRSLPRSPPRGGA